MNIDVVIPVMNQCHYTKSLLEDIAANTVIPKSIIIINNNSTDETEVVVREFQKDLPIKYIKNIKNVGVNASWNLGVCYANHDLISFLNNDLVLNPYFFEVTTNVFLKNPDCGMTYPKSFQGGGTEKIKEEYISQVRSAQRGSGKVEPVNFREGWAFTMRRSLALKVLIPKELFNYCGDDYHYHFITNHLGHKVLRMLDNPVYHYGNVTGGTSGLHKRMNEDTRKWHKLVKEDLETLSKRAF
jgi:GT2 family glycosyltransferase